MVAIIKLLADGSPLIMSLVKRLQNKHAAGVLSWEPAEPATFLGVQAGMHSF